MIQQLLQIAAGPQAYLQGGPGEPQPEIVAGVVLSFQWQAAQILSDWNAAYQALIDAEIEMNLAQAGDELSEAPPDPEESYHEYATAYASIMGLRDNRDGINSVMGLFENFNAVLLDALGAASSPQNGTATSSSQNEASGSGVQQITFQPDESVSPMTFAATDEYELANQMAEDPQFAAWARSAFAGWDDNLQSLANVMAHSVFP